MEKYSWFTLNKQVRKSLLIRPCSHWDKNLSLVFAKKWKFCYHQFFVFVILFAHEDAKIFWWQMSISNLGIVMTLVLISVALQAIMAEVPWIHVASVQIDLAQLKIVGSHTVMSCFVIHMLRNLMTQWWMDVQAQKLKIL